MVRKRNNGVWGKMFLQDHHVRVFPGGSVVKNPPLTAGDMSLTLVRELRSHIPWGT